MSLPSINFLHLTVSEIYPGQNFVGQGHYSKVKSRSHHDIVHLQTLTNVPTKYQLLTPCVFQDISRTRFYRSRSLQQGQRSNQGHAMTLHTYTSQPPYQLPQPYGCQDIACIRFYSQGHNSKVKGQIKVTPWRCTPTTPNQCPYQISTSCTSRFLRYSLDKIL